MRLFFWLIAFFLLSTQVFCGDEFEIRDPSHEAIPTARFESLFHENRDFTNQERDVALEWFKYAGRNIDNNPKRIQICKRALDRFINAFSEYPLSDLLHCMQFGLSYSPPNNQMTDFYLTGIGKIYAEALRRYPDDKHLVFESVKGLFGVIYDIPDYKLLMNTILAGLLERGCITSTIAENLTRQQMHNSAKGKGPQWLNQNNENRLWSLLVDNASK